jgi:hypothetical protein
MYGWTPKSIDEKAQRDLEKDEYDPPPGWLGTLQPGTEARDRYDRARKHHKHDDD